MDLTMWNDNNYNYLIFIVINANSQAQHYTFYKVHSLANFPFQYLTIFIFMAHKSVLHLSIPQSLIISW